MSQSIDHVFQTDFNRAVSAQFAPNEKRYGLRLLCALDAELAKIPHQASDLLLQRIRTQFWREALFEKDGAGHALAKELIDCFSPIPGLFAKLDKLIMVHEKNQESDKSLEQIFEGFCERQAVMFELGCAYLLAPKQEMSEIFYQRCGRAYGGAYFLCTQEISLLDKKDEFQTLRDQTEIALHDVLMHLQDLDPSARAAVLPIALVPPYLDLFQASDKADGQPIDLHPARKVWLLWRALRKGFV